MIQVHRRKQSVWREVVHKPPICEEHLKNLYECTAFGLNDLEKLQNKVFFEVMLYFCRRGRQNLRQLTKTDFSFNTDSTGARYVCKSTNELTRKPPGRWRRFRWRFDVWKTWSKLSCGFLRPISKSFKFLERVFISAPKEKRLHFWGCLIRQHGGRWQSVHLVKKWKTYREKQNKASVTQTI